MKIKFWGVRGSIPSPLLDSELRSKIKLTLLEALEKKPTKKNLETFIDSLPAPLKSHVGGNTPCLEVSNGKDILIFDAGSGIKNLGISLNPKPSVNILEEYISLSQDQPDTTNDENALTMPGTGLKINLFLTHTHWDHIQGFPFFSPIYHPSNTIDIYGVEAESLKQALMTQQASPNLFPISFESLSAKINFHNFPKEGLQIGPFFIEAIPLPHPGGSLAFRIKDKNRSVVLATDYEFLDNLPETKLSRKKLTRFIEKADVFISDTQYTYLESMTKEGWGHSNSLSVVEMAVKAGVQKFFLFHHDPDYSDAKLYDMLEKTIAYTKLLHPRNSMTIGLASEGTIIEL
jgi:phosphoribosyl 1,2-cyclic phosphodiesterase